MTNIASLATALKALDFDVLPVNDTLFVEGWTISCTITGRVKAKHGQQEGSQFTLGTLYTTPDILAEVFAETVALW